MARRFHLPNFIGYCPFELHIHPQCRANMLASEKWLSQHISPVSALSDPGLKLGLLASMCYPTVDSAQLRVCTDMLGLLAVIRTIAKGPGCSPERIDKVKEVILNAITLPQRSGANTIAAGFQDVWKRLCKTCPMGLQARLVLALEDWFNSLIQYAHDKATGAIPDIESYLEWRRTESACDIAFLLLEYAHELSSAPNNRLVQELRRVAIDLIIFADDVYSYKHSLTQQSSHNLVSILMLAQGSRLQDAVNSISSIYQATLKSFTHTSHNLPSTIFLRGLEDWIVGSLHWPFETVHYFGNDSMTVRELRVVELI